MGCNSHDFYDRIMKQQTLIQSMIVTDITWIGFTDSIDVQLSVTIPTPITRIARWTYKWLKIRLEEGI